MRTAILRSQLIYWIILTLVILLSGCAALTRNYGTFVPDESVARYFENYQIDPDMNYYFSGSDLNPNAIMGLRKEYVLDNDLWRPMKPDRKVLKDLVEGMYHKVSYTGLFLHGFVMKSPDGRNLGVWYSLLHVKMRVKMGEGNKVVVFTPEQHVYIQDQGDNGDKGDILP